MTPVKRLGFVAISLWAALSCTPGAMAHPNGSAGCDPGSYSPLHYWLPTVWRVRACFGPREPTYPPDRYPGIPITYRIQTYPCPYGPPPARLCPRLGGTDCAAPANVPAVSDAPKPAAPAAPTPPAPAPMPK